MLYQFWQLRRGRRAPLAGGSLPAALRGGGPGDGCKEVRTRTVLSTALKPFGPAFLSLDTPDSRSLEAVVDAFMAGLILASLTRTRPP